MDFFVLRDAALNFLQILAKPKLSRDLVALTRI